MIAVHFTFKDAEGTDIYVYKWLPDEGTPLKAIVQISHGMAETAARYERLARALTENGYMVYANDHQGHGQTAQCLDNVGFIGEAGFDGMLQSMKQLTDLIAAENEETPIFLFGHSMGSFLVQRYIQKYGQTLQGAILSGTDGKQSIMIHLAIWLAAREVKKYGERHCSLALTKLVFGSYNNAFKPNRTHFDWLSRDHEEVDKYIGDSFCGTIFTASFYYHFFSFLKKLHQEQNLQQIPKRLPLYLFAGDKDPVGNNGKGVLNLIKLYKKHKIENISYRLYKNGRHEMLNEINRDEVERDLVAWLDSQLADDGAPISAALSL
jgi:alpha-beta hydrolase superfamily lysophospholipase